MSTSSIEEQQQTQTQQQHQQIFSDWSQLPVNFIIMLASTLNSIEDLYSIGGVCSSWRCVTVSVRKHKNKTLPWLMLTAQYSDTHRDFYSVAENKTYRSNYTKAFYDCQCWGSPFGWLVCLDHSIKRCGHIHLVNPFSPLSPRRTLPSYWKLPGECDGLTKRYIYKAAVFKLHKNIHHHDQFIVFAIYGIYKDLAYSRPGDDTWTRVTFPTTHNYPALVQGQRDILHLNGQFYSVDFFGNIWQLCDTTSGGGTNLPMAIPFASSPLLNEKFGCSKTCSLIEMEGELHVAFRFQHSHTLKTILIEIFKCDASTREWQKLTTLGDYALFLGACTSISVKASDYSATNCKPNFIYFCYDDYSDRTTLGQPDTGILDVERFVVRPLNAEGKSTRCFSAPAWLIPNLL